MKGYARNVIGGLRGLRRGLGRASGGCDAVTVVYDPVSRSFTIRAYNEYGDSAYLSEDVKETKSLVRNIWTKEIVVLEGDKVVGVI